MLGFDWVSIVAAGIGGAVGGAIGALLGSLTKNQTARVMLIVVAAVLGGNLLKTLIEPEVERAIGQQVRTAAFDTQYDAEIRPGLMEQPALARIFKEDPKVEDAFKAELRAAYQKGGAKGALEAAPGIGARTLGAHFVRFLSRARGQDLFDYAKTMGMILVKFRDKDPEACVLMLFGAQHGQPITNTRMENAVGKDAVKALLAVSNAIVENAAPAPIPFDKTRGETLTTEIGQRHGPLLTGKSLGVATGARLHTTRDEAHAACAFSAALFADLTALPAADSELALRYMFN